MTLSTPVSLLQRLGTAAADRDWHEFVDLYSPLLFAWAQRLGLSDHDAADLVQDVFATLIEKLPTFQYDHSKSFRAWLKTILQNRWRQWQRKGGRHRRIGGDSKLAEVADDDGSDFVEAEYTRHVAQRALAVLRADFEPTTWTIFWAFVVLERPAAEVSAEFGVTVNGVYLAKSRVLRRLREELTGLLD